MCFCLATIAICFASTLVSAQVGDLEFSYFGKKVDATMTIFVPSVFFGLLHFIVFGFALNLYCYHVWLRKNNLSTLDHILKYKGSKKLGQVKPLPPPIAEDKTQRDLERTSHRQPLKLKSNSNHNSVNSREEDLILSSDKRIESQKSLSSEGFLLGRPKSKFEKAEEYFRYSEKRIASKNISELSKSDTGKGSTDQRSDRHIDSQYPKSQFSPQLPPLPPPLSIRAKPLPKLDEGPNHSAGHVEQKTDAKKIPKRKLLPMKVDNTEPSNSSKAKE